MQPPVSYPTLPAARTLQHYGGAGDALLSASSYPEAAKLQAQSWSSAATAWLYNTLPVPQSWRDEANKQADVDDRAMTDAALRDVYTREKYARWWRYAKIGAVVAAGLGVVAIVGGTVLIAKSVRGGVPLRNPADTSGSSEVVFDYRGAKGKLNLREMASINAALGAVGLGFAMLFVPVPGGRLVGGTMITLGTSLILGGLGYFAIKAA